MIDPGKSELVRYYAWLHRAGYNDSHSGNASKRSGRQIWITPSGAGAATLREGDLIRCDPETGCAPGASMDAPIHLAIYRAVPSARAVLHSHCPHVLAWGISAGQVPLEDLEGRVYFPAVPVVDVEFAHYHAQAPERVATALASSPVVLVRDHGVYAWGESLEQAYKWTSSVEHSARIAWLSAMLRARGV